MALGGGGGGGGYVKQIKMPKNDESASMQAWNCYAIWTKVNGHYRKDGCSSEVAIKRGTTVATYYHVHKDVL